MYAEIGFSDESFKAVKCKFETCISAMTIKFHDIFFSTDYKQYMLSENNICYQTSDCHSKNYIGWIVYAKIQTGVALQ